MASLTTEEPQRPQALVAGDSSRTSRAFRIVRVNCLPN
jgi:hypothetical protein